MEGKMPLIGDMFPQIEVQTTHGLLKLPDAFGPGEIVLSSGTIRATGKRIAEGGKRYVVFDLPVTHYQTLRIVL